MKKALILLLCPLFLSCVVTQQLDIEKDENISTTYLTVQDFFVDVMNDFADFSGENRFETTDKSVMDFRDSLLGCGQAENVHFIKVNDYSYVGVFTFEDLNALLCELGSDRNQSILTLKERGLFFHLDINNYPQLCRMIPFLRNREFEPFGPLYNRDIDRQSYYEMIDFMLGDGGSDAIKASTITITVRCPQPVTRHTNGSVNKNEFTFSFPLIDFLLLHEPIECSAQW